MVRFVTCETEVACVLHVRRGTFKPCGQQDSRTLCNRKPARDTKCPVESVLAGDERTCRTCAELVRQETA